MDNFPILFFFSVDLTLESLLIHISISIIIIIFTAVALFKASFVVVLFLVHYFLLLLLQHGLSNDYLLQSVLAENDVLERARICRLSLHQLNEAIGDLVPLPVNHYIKNRS